jgi:hypothetical protein
MSNKQELAEWLYANQDKQGTPEFNEKKAQFKAADAALTEGKIIVPPRGKSSVEILQDEYIKEYERPAATPEEQSRKEANLGSLTRELASLKAQPPEVQKKESPASPAVEEESPALSGLRQDINSIETKKQEQQPADMRLNAQVAGAAIGAVPGAVQQAAVLREAGGRGLGAAMDAIAERVRGPSTVSDLAEDVIRGEIPQGLTPASLNQNATRFYRQFPNELANGDMAAGGRGTYAYARSFQLPIELSMQAVDLKDAQRLVQERRAGTLKAQAAFPSETLVERPTSGLLTLDERREPRSRLIIGGDQPPPAPQPAPQPSPQQPRSGLPPRTFQPGVPALLQPSPTGAPLPPPAPRAPIAEPPILGPAALGDQRPMTSAARPAVRSGLDAITNLFKSKDSTLGANPVGAVLGALPIVPKTLGGMQIGGGGAEMATGIKQGDTGKIGTGAAEMLGGGLSMFGKTAPAGMAISILAELYRNARTPEDRQKIMDALNGMMFGKEQPKQIM